MPTKSNETVRNTPKQHILNRPVGFREVTLHYENEKNPDQLTAITVVTVKAREIIADIGPTQLVATTLNWRVFH